MKPYGPEVYDRVAELWAQNLTTSEIGAALDIPKNSVCRMAFTARSRGDERFPMRETFFRKESKMARPVFPAALPSPRTASPPRLYELIAGQCKYPVSTEDGEHRFCAATQRPGSPYCHEHHAICNGPTKGLTMRALARV